MTPEQRWLDAIDSEAAQPTTDWVPDLDALRRALAARLEHAWLRVLAYDEEHAPRRD